MHDFFVMLNTQNHDITPLVNDAGELETYATLHDAKKAGAKNPLGQHYGFEVFERGAGVYDA